MVFIRHLIIGLSILLSLTQADLFAWTGRVCNLRLPNFPIDDDIPQPIPYGCQIITRTSMPCDQYEVSKDGKKIISCVTYTRCPIIDPDFKAYCKKYYDKTDLPFNEEFNKDKSDNLDKKKIEEMKKEIEEALKRLRNRHNNI